MRYQLLTFLLLLLFLVYLPLVTADDTLKKHDVCEVHLTKENMQNYCCYQEPPTAATITSWAEAMFTGAGSVFHSSGVPSAQLTISMNGHLLFNKAFTRTNDEYRPMQLDSEHFFPAAQLTEVMTGLAMLQIVSDYETVVLGCNAAGESATSKCGETLDLLVSDLAPGLPSSYRRGQLTLRDLLFHVSGIDRTDVGMWSKDTPAVPLSSNKPQPRQAWRTAIHSAGRTPELVRKPSLFPTDSHADYAIAAAAVETLLERVMRVQDCPHTADIRAYIDNYLHENLGLENATVYNLKFDEVTGADAAGRRLVMGYTSKGSPLTKRGRDGRTLHANPPQHKHWPSMGAWLTGNDLARLMQILSTTSRDRPSNAPFADGTPCPAGYSCEDEFLPPPALAADGRPLPRLTPLQEGALFSRVWRWTPFAFASDRVGTPDRPCDDPYGVKHPLERLIPGMGVVFTERETNGYHVRFISGRHIGHGGFIACIDESDPASGPLSTHSVRGPSFRVCMSVVMNQPSSTLADKLLDSFHDTFFYSHHACDRRNDPIPAPSLGRLSEKALDSFLIDTRMTRGSAGFVELLYTRNAKDRDSARMRPVHVKRDGAAVTALRLPATIVRTNPNTLFAALPADWLAVCPIPPTGDMDHDISVNETLTYEILRRSPPTDLAPPVAPPAWLQQEYYTTVYRNVDQPTVAPVDAPVPDPSDIVDSMHVVVLTATDIACAENRGLNCYQGGTVGVGQPYGYYQGKVRYIVGGRAALEVPSKAINQEVAMPVCLIAIMISVILVPIVLAATDCRQRAIARSDEQRCAALVRGTAADDIRRMRSPGDAPARNPLAVDHVHSETGSEVSPAHSPRASIGSGVGGVLGNASDDSDGDLTAPTIARLVHATSSPFGRLPDTSETLLFNRSDFDNDGDDQSAEDLQHTPWASVLSSPAAAPAPLAQAPPQRTKLMSRAASIGLPLAIAFSSVLIGVTAFGAYSALSQDHDTEFPDIPACWFGTDVALKVFLISPYLAFVSFAGVFIWFIKATATDIGLSFVWLLGTAFGLICNGIVICYAHVFQLFGYKV